MSGSGMQHHPPARTDASLGACSGASWSHDAAWSAMLPRLAETFARLGDAVIATDSDGRISFVNTVAAHLIGWRAADAIGRACGEVFHLIEPGTRRRATCPAKHALRPDEPSPLQHVLLVTRAGRRTPIDVSGAPVHDDRGALIGAVVAFRDVTEFTHADQARARLAAIVESSTDAIVGQDLHGTVHDWNPAAKRRYGYDAAEMIGRKIDALSPPGREHEEGRLVEAVRLGRGVKHYATQRRRKDGTLIDVSISASPIKDRDGRVVGVAKIARDITAEQRIAQALRESEDRFRTMADAAPVLIWVTDHLGQCTYVNRPWLTFTGRSMEQETGDGWLASVHDDDRDRCRDMQCRATRMCDSFRLKYRLRRADGTYRWMLAQGVPRYLPDGAFAGHVGSAIDVTDLEQAQWQLRSINELLEQRVAERTAQLRELAAQLTHAEQKERRRLAQTLHDHLQQLLVAARMRTDLALRHVRAPARGGDGADAADHAAGHTGASDAGGAGDAAEVIRQVRELIGESIEASRSLTVELSPPVLYDGGLTAALPWLARRMRERQGLEVAVAVPDHAEPPDEETRVTLFLAARELLFNVAKHANTRSARLALSAQPDGRARLVVEDDGEGFDPDQIVRRDDPSTGFGLFSLKERIEFFGGGIAIRSSPGHGSRVAVTMPYRAPRRAGDGEPIATPADAPPLVDGGDAPIRVVLADDHKILREGIAGILAEHRDIRVVAEAADGHEAVDLTRRHRPHVVVMDITMPRLNGIEATRQIARELPKVVVLGLSMHDSEDMARAIREAGATQLLVKDGPSDALIEAIRNAVRRT